MCMQRFTRSNYSTWTNWVFLSVSVSGFFVVVVRNTKSEKKKKKSTHTHRKLHPHQKPFRLAWLNNYFIKLFVVFATGSNFNWLNIWLENPPDSNLLDIEHRVWAPIANNRVIASIFFFFFFEISHFEINVTNEFELEFVEVKWQRKSSTITITTTHTDIESCYSPWPLLTVLPFVSKIWLSSSWSSDFSSANLLLLFFTMDATSDSERRSVVTSRNFSAPSLI